MDIKRVRGEDVSSIRKLMYRLFSCVVRGDGEKLQEGRERQDVICERDELMMKKNAFLSYVLLFSHIFLV